MISNGQNLIFAMKKAAAWGTALACGAGDGILLSSYNSSRKQESTPNNGLNEGWSKDAEKGAIAANLALGIPLRYDGMDLPVALFCGSTAGAPAQQAATTAYLQSFPLTNTNDGLFATAAADNGAGVEEACAKVHRLELKGEVGGYVELLINNICHDIITASATNTQVTMADVTYPEAAHRVHFSHGAFRLNDQDGAGLGGGDVIYPTSFSLVAERKMKGAPHVGGVNTIDEPGNEDIPVVTLKLKFARHNAASIAWWADWRANTAKKMDMVFTGALIEGAYYRYFSIEMPYLDIDESRAPFAKGPIPAELDFNVLGCPSGVAPTGMTAIVPFLISMMYTRTTDVLA